MNNKHTIAVERCESWHVGMAPPEIQLMPHPVLLSILLSFPPVRSHLILTGRGIVQACGER
jgi:hypothetical protein